MGNSIMCLAGGLALGLAMAQAAMASGHKPESYLCVSVDGQYRFRAAPQIIDRRIFGTDITYVMRNLRDDQDVGYCSRQDWPLKDGSPTRMRCTTNDGEVDIDTVTLRYTAVINEDFLSGKTTIGDAGLAIKPGDCTPLQP